MKTASSDKSSGHAASGVPMKAPTGAHGAVQKQLRGLDLAQQESMLSPVQRSASQGAPSGGIGAGAIGGIGAGAAGASQGSRGGPSASAGKRAPGRLDPALAKPGAGAPHNLEGPEVAASSTRVAREAPGLHHGGSRSEEAGGAGGGYDSNWLMGKGESRDFRGHHLVSSDGGQGEGIRGWPTHEINVDLFLALASATGKLQGQLDLTPLMGKSGIDLLKAAEGLELFFELVEEGIALAEEHQEAGKVADLKKHKATIVEYQKKKALEPSITSEEGPAKAGQAARGKPGVAASAGGGATPSAGGNYVVGQGMVPEQQVAVIYEIATSEDGVVWSRALVIGGKRFARDGKEVSMREVPAELVGADPGKWGHARGYAPTRCEYRKETKHVKETLPEGTTRWEALPWRLPWPDLK